MKGTKSARAWLAAAATFALLTAEHRGVSIQQTGGRWEGRGEARTSGSAKGYHPSSPPVVIKMRRYSMPAPQRIQNPSHVIRGGGHVAWPSRDGRGRPIRQQPALNPPARHAAVVRNPAVVQSIRRDQKVEIQPGRYYWHDVGRVRYAHYRDRRGDDWYGFYHGPRFYWTRYWADRWWWYDPRFERWVYWWDGYWWWPGPAGGVYVYVDNNYYPYDDGTVTVEQPVTAAPPQAVPASADQGSSTTSPDGTRMVQIYGDRRDAFLYSVSSGRPAFMKYLASGVKKARFSGGQSGKPLRLLLDLDDGSFALYDESGQPLDGPSISAAPGAVPQAPPPSGPPPAPPGE